MKNIAIIAVCDFEKKPMGGEVFLLSNLLKEKCEEDINIKLIGLSFDKEDIIGEWKLKNINGIEYEFLPVAYANTRIPLRFQVVNGIKKFKNNILKKDIRCIYIHSAELIIPFINDDLDVVYHVHGNPTRTLEISRFPLFRNNLFSKIYKYFVRKTIEKSKLIIWAADRNKEEYISANPYMKSIVDRKSITIHSSFDNNLVYNENEKIFEFNSSKKYLISVGRLNKGKQVDLIIKSFAKLKNENVEIIICGDGEEKKSLKNLANTLDVGNKVHFMGSVNRSQLAYLLSNSDVFLFASKSEALSLVVLESLYMGTPVVSTDVGDISLVVKSGITGEIVSLDFFNNVELFSEKIDYVLDKGKEYYAKNCRIVANEFSPHKMSKSIYYNLGNY